MIRTCLSLAMALTVLVLMSQPAGATDTLVNSQSPYWDVGPRDKPLSLLCSMGKFNQRDPGHWVVRLRAKDGGSAVLGIAKGTGFNLWDPKHKGKSGETYFFRNDTTSTCAVFVTGRAGAPPAAPRP